MNPHKEKKSLYVVSHDYTELSKIGVSKDITKRIKTIRSSIGADLKIYYESPQINNWREVEALVIKQFKTNETFGEWVKANPKDIVEFIKTIEYTFDNPEYTFIESNFIKAYEKVLQVSSPFYYSNFKLQKTDRDLKEVDEGVYCDSNFIFYVCYHLDKQIYTVSFDVFKSAVIFAKSLSNRLVKLDLDNKSFIINPKFSI